MARANPDFFTTSGAQGARFWLFMLCRRIGGTGLARVGVACALL